MALKKELVFEGLRRMFLSDENVDLKNPLSIQDFCLGRDLGVRPASLKLGKVGSWTGDYRWLELFSRKVKNPIYVLFNVWKADEFAPRPVLRCPSKRKKIEKAKAKEEIQSEYVLIVGRGNETEQHLSLKLDFEKYIVGQPNKKVRIFHDGEPNPLKTCPKRRLDALKSIRKRVPTLFRLNVDENAWLGRITERRRYSINNEDIYDMLLKLAIYASYLDKFKSKYRKRMDKRIFV